MTALVADIETPRLPLDRIRSHPANPRLNAVADAEMVDSIAHQGVLDPLMVAPISDEPGYWVLIDGHRRKDGALRAGLSEVPVTPRPDLVTEAQQLEVMVITGLQKQLLSPVEEAAAYEQLTLCGMDAATIAAATGFSLARVKSRMKLTHLTVTGRDALHAGDLTLLDAEALLEFADDPAAVERLEAQAQRPGQFRAEVHQLRGARERCARNVEAIAGHVAAGAEPAGLNGTRDLRRFATDDLRSPQAHVGCLGYYAGVPDSYEPPFLVCTDPATHNDQAPTLSSEPSDEQRSQWEKNKEAREAERLRRAAATQVRLGWLVEHLAGLFPPRSHGDLVKAARAGLPLLLIDQRDVPDSASLASALGIPATPSYAEQIQAVTSYAATLATAKPPAVLDAFARYLAALIGEQLDTDPHNLEDAHEAHYLLAVWDWMKAVGYQPCDVDIEIRTALEVRHTELLDQAEDDH